MSSQFKVDGLNGNWWVEPVGETLLHMFTGPRKQDVNQEDPFRRAHQVSFSSHIYGCGRTFPTWRTCLSMRTRSPPSPSSHDFLTPPLNEAPPPAPPPTTGPSEAAPPPPPLDETLMWSYLHTGHTRVMHRGSDVIRKRGGNCHLPAALPVHTRSSLVELADGGGFAVGGVVGEQAAAALPAHAVEEVPATQLACYTCGTGRPPNTRSLITTATEPGVSSNTPRI